MRTCRVAAGTSSDEADDKKYTSAKKQLLSQAEQLLNISRNKRQISGWCDSPFVHPLFAKTCIAALSSADTQLKNGLSCAHSGKACHACCVRDSVSLKALVQPALSCCMILGSDRPCTCSGQLTKADCHPGNGIGGSPSPSSASLGSSSSSSASESQKSSKNLQCSWRGFFVRSTLPCFRGPSLTLRLSLHQRPKPSCFSQATRKPLQLQMDNSIQE